MPSRGFGFTASTKPLADDKPKIGERLGHNWKVKPATNRAQNYVMIDTNSWKTFAHERLKQHANDAGALRLFGRPGAPSGDQDHRLVADHLHSEFPTRTEGHGRSLLEWKLVPGQRENHYFDCLVGCMVAASMCGASLMDLEPGKRKKKLSLRALQEAQRSRRAS